MTLLERDQVLEELTSLVERARVGHGSLVALGGEAGIGKTSVVRALGTRLERVRFMVGHCDSLGTPRPLGPLHDIALDPASGMAGPLSDGRARHSVFDAFLEELRSTLRPAVVVLEDVHWADEATLDLVRFVGRRIADTYGVVVLTYRDDEVGPNHPLTGVLGDLASARGVRRMVLTPLSVDAVRALVGDAEVHAESLHAATRGNPFFVTEVLAVGEADLPRSVSDAVLARAARLGEGARRLVDAASVVPDRVEGWLLARLVDAEAADRAAAIEVGLLVPVEGGLRFRHDLARLAIEGALEPDTRLDLHRKVLEALEDPPDGRPDAERLSHHAVEAGDRVRIVRWGRPAAERAAKNGAYAASYTHAQRVLEAGTAFAADERAVMLEMLGRAALLIDNNDMALAAHEEAYHLWLGVGDTVRAAVCLADMASDRLEAGDGDAADEAIRVAVEMVEGVDPSDGVGKVLAQAAHLAMLGRDVERALALGADAATVGERISDPFVVARAHTSMGAALIVADRPGGEEHLLKAVDIAARESLPWVEASALGNLGTGLGEARSYGAALRYLERSIEHASRFDLDYYGAYGTAWLGRVHFEQGRWGVAALHAAQALAMTPATGSVTTPIVALTVQARISERRGSSGGKTLLDRAWELAQSTDSLQRTWPVAAGLAESAWLTGRPREATTLVASVLERATDRGTRWAIGELAYWLWRFGALDEVPDGAAAPYGLQITGDWRAAADAWRHLGCPYEEADALSDGDVDARLEAVRIWDELGAGPAPARLRKQLRGDGVTVPRGPRASTQRNAGGLTPRQLEVLRLLVEGQSNAGIAERMFVSAKTVDHHVSAVLAKLGVTSRGEAVAEALRLGLVEAPVTDR